MVLNYGSSIKVHLINLHERLNCPESLDHLQKWIIFYYFYIARNSLISILSFRNDFYKYFIQYNISSLPIQKNSYELNIQIENVLFYLKHADFSSMKEHFEIIVKLINEKSSDSLKNYYWDLIQIFNKFIDYCDYLENIINNKVEFCMLDLNKYASDIGLEIQEHITKLQNKGILEKEKWLIEKIIEIFDVLFGDYNAIKKV